MCTLFQLNTSYRAPRRTDNKHQSTADVQVGSWPSYTVKMCPQPLNFCRYFHHHEDLGDAERCQLYNNFVPSEGQCNPYFRMLVVWLVLSRLNYGNATLARISAYQRCRLQSMINAAAKLIHRHRRYDHVTLLLCDSLVKSPERVVWKLAVTIYKTVSMVWQHNIWLKAISASQTMVVRILRSTSTEL